MTGSCTSDVRPGQPVTDFALAPYPGERPAGSWVIDPAGLLFGVRPDTSAPSGWRVISVTDGDARCLDDWLSDHGGAPMSERVPVLSYGSNANPQKVVRNGVSMPAVSLGCTVEDLAAVWCRDTRDILRLPATLLAWPGSRESHALSYVIEEDFAPLDLVEGRASDWYRLIRLAEGRIVRDDGIEPEGIVSYVGGRPDRLPLVDANGRAVRLVDMDHATALRAARDERYASGAVPDLGPVVIGEA